MAAALVLTANSAPPAIEVTVDNVRSGRGLLRLCLTRQERFFPNCADDPAAITATVPATTRRITLIASQPGRYALAILHDENGNGRADTILGVPREGFGFSRNPPIRFGPPRFAATLIEIASGGSSQTVRLHYLL